MEKPQKILATKYILFKLSEWYKEVTGQNEENDLSILKTLKLIFLLCTVDLDSKEHLIDKGFSFNALPYGPVEKDIYDYYKSGVFKGIIETSGLNTKEMQLSDFKSLDENLKHKIDENFDELKSKNKLLIIKSATYLVELTHRFNSWEKSFKIAKDQGKFSHPMAENDIINDVKFYSF